MIFWKRRKKKALVADDDRGTLDLFSFLLRQEGWDVVEAHSGEEVVSKAQDEQPSVLVLDQLMPGQSGSDAYETLKSMGVNIPAVLISGAADIAETARRHGIARFFRKPVDIAELLEALEEAGTAA